MTLLVGAPYSKLTSANFGYHKHCGSWGILFYLLHDHTGLYDLRTT